MTRISSKITWTLLWGSEKNWNLIPSWLGSILVQVIFLENFYVQFENQTISNTIFSINIVDGRNFVKFATGFP